MTLFEMVSELHEMLESGEIDDSIENLPWNSNEFNPAKFIRDMFQNLSPDDEQAREEISERQIAVIHQIYEGYANGDWKGLEEYL